MLMKGWIKSNHINRIKDLPCIARNSAHDVHVRTYAHSGAKLGWGGGTLYSFDQHPDLERNLSRPFQRNAKHLMEAACLSAEALPPFCATTLKADSALRFERMTFK